MSAPQSEAAEIFRSIAMTLLAKLGRSPTTHPIANWLPIVWIP